MEILLLVAAVALVCWLLTLLPLPDPFPKIIIVVGVVICVIALLDYFLGLNLVASLKHVGRH